MPYFKIAVTKEISTTLYIEAKNEESIRSLYDDQLSEIIDEQCHHSDWDDNGFIDIDSVEEIAKEEYSSYEGTNLEEFIKDNG